jgi:hypothetical protein
VADLTQAGLIRWRDVYHEAELYKAAVRVYTKPLFLWRKALLTSTDGKTLYDLAAHGLKGLANIHKQLLNEEFHFRPSIGLKYNFNGKRRTLYIPPWEERIVDLLLYRLLNCRLNRYFSSSSYAYRDHTYGLDRCQARLAAVVRSACAPLYLVKRDISDYFPSVNHDILLHQLAHTSIRRTTSSNSSRSEFDSSTRMSRDITGPESAFPSVVPAPASCRTCI